MLCTCSTALNTRRGWLVGPAAHHLSRSKPSSYRCPTGPPGPTRARARPGSVTSEPCLARPYSLAGRAGSAHGLRRRPKHKPTGLFHDGPAHEARPASRARDPRGPRWGRRCSAAGGGAVDRRGGDGGGEEARDRRGDGGGGGEARPRRRQPMKRR